jgi:hypothetical protein
MASRSRLRATKHLVHVMVVVEVEALKLNTSERSATKCIRTVTSVFRAGQFELDVDRNARMKSQISVSPPRPTPNQFENQIGNSSTWGAQQKRGRDCPHDFHVVLIPFKTCDIVVRVPATSASVKLSFDIGVRLSISLRLTLTVQFESMTLSWIPSSSHKPFDGLTVTLPCVGEGATEVPLDPYRTVHCILRLRCPASPRPTALVHAFFLFLFFFLFRTYNKILLGRRPSCESVVHRLARHTCAPMHDYTLVVATRMTSPPRSLAASSADCENVKRVTAGDHRSTMPDARRTMQRASWLSSTRTSRACARTDLCTYYAGCALAAPTDHRALNSP